MAVVIRSKGRVDGFYRLAHDLPLLRLEQVCTGVNYKDINHDHQHQTEQTILPALRGYLVPFAFSFVYYDTYLVRWQDM